jgi:hypothetical protein
LFGARCALGVDAELLKDSGYIEYQLGMDIEGREVSFGTKDEEYNGRHSVKVVWIGKKSDPNLSRSAARFFGGVIDSRPKPGGYRAVFSPEMLSPESMKARPASCFLSILSSVLFSGQVSTWRVLLLRQYW